MKDHETKRKIKTMDVILVLIFCTLLVFTVEMIRMYKTFGSIPDTLVTCVFAALGGECGIMGWIRTTKDKQQDRRDYLEDRDHDEHKGGNDP